MPKVTPKELRDRLAQHIRDAATCMGITLTDFADRAGVSQAAFWAAMAGTSGPSIDLSSAKIKVAMATRACWSSRPASLDHGST